LVFLSVLAGCATERRCNIKFPPQRDTIKIITIRDSIIYKDTTIFIKLPGEVRIDSVFIPCPPPPPQYIPDTARAETSLSLAKAWWSYPVIKLKLTQKDTTIMWKLDNAIKEAYHWRMEYQKIKEVKEIKYVPKIYKQALSICIFLFIIFGIWLGYKFFKR